MIDVIGIKNVNGETLARYRYDAWGACTITYDNDPDTEFNALGNISIATINPFRYRSYYYDSETELYYLQSRYYDPCMGRFLNADDATIIILLNVFYKNNLFSYCYNNPIRYSDYYGYAPKQSEVPPPSSGYVAPKGGPKKGKTKKGSKGWVDKNGNVWVPDKSNHGLNRKNGDGDHWDVTGSDGYINVGRDGKAWGGKGKVKLPKASKNKIKFGKIIGGFFIILIIAAIVSLVNLSGGAVVVFAAI